MRTFAIVGLPMSVDGALAAPHQAILDGGSIGATFKSAGWDVVKRNLAIEQITAVEELAVQLEIAAGSKVAMHAYELEVERAGDRYFYATIIEMHHPDYLDLSSLEDIYAELGPYDGPPNESVHHLALEGVSRLASLNLSLSQ